MHKSHYADTHRLFSLRSSSLSLWLLLFLCEMFFGMRVFPSVVVVYSLFACTINVISSFPELLCCAGFFLFNSFRWPTITAQIFKFKCNVPIFLYALFFSVIHSISFTLSFCRVCVWMLRNSSVCNPFEFPISLQHNRLHVLLPPYDMWKCTHTLNYIVIWSGI